MIQIKFKLADWTNKGFVEYDTEVSQFVNEIPRIGEQVILSRVTRELLIEGIEDIDNANEYRYISSITYDYDKSAVGAIYIQLVNKETYDKLFHTLYNI